MVLLLPCVTPSGAKPTLSMLLCGLPGFVGLRVAPPEVVDDQGRPRHTEGVTPLSGLMFLRLSWQRSRASALLGGVGRDAAVLAQPLVDWCSTETVVRKAVLTRQLTVKRLSVRRP